MCWYGTEASLASNMALKAWYMVEPGAVKKVGVLEASLYGIVLRCFLWSQYNLHELFPKKAHVPSGSGLSSLACLLQCQGTRSGHGKPGTYKLPGNLIMLVMPLSSSNLKTNVPFPFACNACSPMPETRCSTGTTSWKWFRLPLIKQEAPVSMQILKESKLKR